MTPMDRAERHFDRADVLDRQADRLGAMSDDRRDAPDRKRRKARSTRTGALRDLLGYCRAGSSLTD